MTFGIIVGPTCMPYDLVIRNLCFCATDLRQSILLFSPLPECDPPLRYGYAVAPSAKMALTSERYIIINIRMFGNFGLFSLKNE